jgi:hypothetical protein
MKKYLVFILILCFSFTGCLHKQGYAKASIYYRSMMTSVLSDPAWYNQYYNETDPQKKKELRDRLIGYCIWLADENYNSYAARFSRNQAIGSVAADWGSLAFSGASTIATPAALYGAISTGIQGANAAYNRDALNQQSRTAILLKMSALRQEELIEIYKSELLPDSSYSLVQGLIDVQHYANAGTVSSALAAIAQDAAVQHQASSAVLRGLRH